MSEKPGAINSKLGKIWTIAQINLNCLKSTQIARIWNILCLRHAWNVWPSTNWEALFKLLCKIRTHKGQRQWLVTQKRMTWDESKSIPQELSLTRISLYWLFIYGNIENARVGGRRTFFCSFSSRFIDLFCLLDMPRLLKFDIHISKRQALVLNPLWI